MDKRSKKQYEAQQSSAYYGARSIGTLAKEGLTTQTQLVKFKDKNNNVHSNFPKHHQIK